MGIVNVTPDSFYDGGVHLDKNAAIPHTAVIHHALQLLDDGAYMLDIGGESSRPSASPISAEAEWERIAPIITGIVAKRPDALISVDTTKAFVAHKALLAGAHCINDVSACLFDPALLELVGDIKPGYVLMHNTGRADNPLQFLPNETLEYKLLTFFETQIARLVAAGLPTSHIMLDPGVGFGTSPELALQMLKIAPSLKQFGCPLLMGISMKSFLGHFFDAPVDERGPWTCMVTAFLVRQGIVWHRVHDVKACAKALRFVEAMHDDI